MPFCDRQRQRDSNALNYKQAHLGLCMIFKLIDKGREKKGVIYGII